jgi:hypothetical protein
MSTPICFPSSIEPDSKDPQPVELQELYEAIGRTLRAVERGKERENQEKEEWEDSEEEEREEGEEAEEGEEQDEGEEKTQQVERRGWGQFAPPVKETKREEEEASYNEEQKRRYRVEEIREKRQKQLQERSRARQQHIETSQFSAFRVPSESREQTPPKKKIAREAVMDVDGGLSSPPFLPLDGNVAQSFSHSLPDPSPRRSGSLVGEESSCATPCTASPSSFESSASSPSRSSSTPRFCSGSSEEESETASESSGHRNDSSSFFRPSTKSPRNFNLSSILSFKGTTSPRMMKRNSRPVLQQRR